MKKIELLREAVQNLYKQSLPDRDEWADWLYDNHVLWVAKMSRKLAEKYDADADLAEAAALLHDIADAKMPRRNDAHEEVSLGIARELLTNCGFDQNEITLVVDDAARYHSCHNGEKPESKEGLVLATADAMAHLQTGFYIYAVRNMTTKNLDEVTQWVLAKLERDYNKKIFFEDERKEVKPAYETLRTIFS